MRMVLDGSGFSELQIFHVPQIVEANRREDQCAALKGCGMASNRFYI
jgi:hypothetical protein